MKICATLMSSKESRLSPAREKRKNGIGRFRADNRGQLFTRRAPHAGDAPERRQQRLAPARADARHVIELRPQIAHRARAAMERHREAMRFVADALNQQQRRIVGRERDRILAIARVEELFLLRDADGDQVREPELLERGVGRRQLSLAAVDDDEIRKRSAELEQLAISAVYDFVHRGEVVLDAGAGSQGLGAGCYRGKEHTSELQSRFDLVCRLLLEKKKKTS